MARQIWLTSQAGMPLYLPLYVELEPAAGSLDCLPGQLVVPSLRVPPGRHHLCTREVRNKGPGGCSGCISLKGLDRSSHCRVLHTKEDLHVSFDPSKHHRT